MPLRIYQYLLSQVVEQGDEQVLSTLKKNCQDLSKLESIEDITELLRLTSTARTTFLVIDALDELSNPKIVQNIIQHLPSSTCKVLLTSRGIPAIKNMLPVGSKSVELASADADMKIYVEREFRESHFAEALLKTEGLMDDAVSRVVSKAANVYAMTYGLILSSIDSALGFFSHGSSLSDF